jgi:transcriptional regulator GlxA family with amidase domain
MSFAPRFMPQRSSATSKSPAHDSRLVLMIAYDNVLLLDVAGPIQVLEGACEILKRASNQSKAAHPPYQLVVGSLAGGDVKTSSGVVLKTVPFSTIARTRKQIDTVLVPGGIGIEEGIGNKALVSWITRHATRVRRMCSICTGAFLLAEAGVLNGRRAVTHWNYIEHLQNKYPRIRVEGDPIYIKDGAIWSSAGISAGIDLALALIEEDLGSALAMQVARFLVVFLKRPGGQSQFSAPLEMQMTAARETDEKFNNLHAWIAAHLTSDLSVQSLARQARMSPRTFARNYVLQTGKTPAKAVELLRLEAARRMLESTTTSIKRAASLCGFGDEERMRRAFVRCIGVNALEYRRRFSTEQ